MRTGVLLLLALTASVFAGCGDAKPKVRVVLLTIDTLRYDSLVGADGGTDMPATLSLAERGLQFERFYASTSTTQPTHASLFTGLHPWQHGVTRNGIVLAEDQATLAEALAEAGFQTTAVVASFPVHSRFGFAQGFREYDDDFVVPYVQQWESQTLEDGHFYSLADTVTDRAIDAIDSTVAHRQFFWFHYFDPHDPYGDAATSERPRGVVHLPEIFRAISSDSPDIAERVRTARALYDRDVASLDEALERLYLRLAEDEDEYETHIVFTSDHGESFGERGALGHGKRLSPEQIHVPFFVVSPRVSSATRVDAAGSVDVPGTILGLVGLDPDGFPGRDLTASSGDEEGAAFGMRRTFATPKKELLTDGTLLPAAEPRFFAVQGGVLVTGNGESLLAADGVPIEDGEAEGEESLRSLFAAFQAILDGVHAEELLDPEVQGALEGLGYTR